MVLKDQDIGNHNDSHSSPSEVLDSGEEIPSCERELLFVRRPPENQHLELEQTQRENIFHTRCKVFENTCSMIMDSDSCCKYCSFRLIDKITLITITHLKPYKLQWIKEDKGILVKEQVSIHISIGHYKERV